MTDFTAHVSTIEELYYQGIPTAEIAAYLNLPIAQIESVVTRIRRDNTGWESPAYDDWDY